MTESSPHQRWFYAAKSALSGILIRFILAVVFICVGCPLLFWLNLFWQQQTSLAKISEQLAVLERYLDGSKSDPPHTVSAQQFIPDDVGLFKLDPRSNGNLDRCERTTTGQFCRAAYVYGSYTVNISVTPLRVGYPESGNMGVYCGDLIGEWHIHKAGKVSYLYYTCPASISSRWFGLVGVTWANGDWLFTAHGNFNELKEFLAAYPY